MTLLEFNDRHSRRQRRGRHLRNRRRPTRPTAAAGHTEPDSAAARVGPFGAAGARRGPPGPAGARRGPPGRAATGGQLDRCQMRPLRNAAGALRPALSLLLNSSAASSAAPAQADCGPSSRPPLPPRSPPRALRRPPAPGREPAPGAMATTKNTQPARRPVNKLAPETSHFGQLLSSSAAGEPQSARSRSKSRPRPSRSRRPLFAAARHAHPVAGRPAELGRGPSWPTTSPGAGALQRHVAGQQVAVESDSSR